MQPSASSKIPFDLISYIVHLAHAPTTTQQIWYLSFDQKTGMVRNTFNRLCSHPSIVILHHMLIFRQQHPPHYIHENMIEYTLSRETSGKKYLQMSSIADMCSHTYSLRRRYIHYYANYIFVDTQYLMAFENNEEISCAWRRGMIYLQGKMFKLNNIWHQANNLVILKESDFDDFGEEPDMYDREYALQSHSWTHHDEVSLGKFVRYDQLPMTAFN